MEDNNLIFIDDNGSPVCSVANLHKLLLPLPEVNNYYCNNTKVARYISSCETYQRIRHLKIAVGRGLFTYVELSCEPQFKIDKFDLEIMNAIYTMLVFGHDLFTDDQLACVLHNDRNKRLTPQEREELRIRIHNLSTIRITLDAKDELASRGISDEQIMAITADTYLLPIESAEVFCSNGVKTIAHSVLKKSTLYLYAEHLKQIICINDNLLKTLGNHTHEELLIKKYIVMRVKQIKGKNKLNSTKIALNGLYNDLDINPESYSNWANKKSRINKIVIATLNNLVECKEIEGYKPYRLNNSKSKNMPIIGYEIIPGKKKKKSH